MVVTDKEARVTRSYNGWEADPVAANINVRRFPIPGTERSLTIRAEVAPILLEVARLVHKEVAPLDEGIWDEWGYAYRPVRGTEFDPNRMSCHASGTAIDLNATRWPRGLRRMTEQQRQVCRSIERKMEGTVVWGGRWTTTPDEHHWEIARGETVASIRDACRQLGLDVPQAADRTLRLTSPAMTGGDVRWVQDKVGVNADGVYGPRTKDAVARWQKAHGLTADGVVGARTWAALRA